MDALGELPSTHIFFVMLSMGCKSQGRRGFEDSSKKFHKGYYSSSERALLLRMVAAYPRSVDNQRQTSLVA